VNNLIASALWHKLAVLEPPIGILMKVQRMVVDFFREKCTGYHCFISFKRVWRSRFDTVS